MRVDSGGYQGSALYGLFDIDAFVMVNNSVITNLVVKVTPDYWYYSEVQGRWAPIGIQEIGMDIICGSHSSQRTEVTINKVVFMSNGAEVGEAYYPGYQPVYSGLPFFDWGCAPNVGVYWNDTKIKLYISVGPGSGISNPLEGYRSDKVLLEWDPKEKSITRIGNYDFDQFGNYIDIWR